MAQWQLFVWEGGEDDISAQLMRLLHSDGNGYFGAASGIGDDNRATSQSTGGFLACPAQACTAINKSAG